MTDNASNALRRSLSGRFVLAVVVGGIVGIGILRTPGEIASVAPDPLLYLGLWIGGGLFVLLNTSVVAELVGMTPRSGGTYPLVRHAYGPYSGFIIGWVDWLSFAADLALKAVATMEFVALLTPLNPVFQTAASVVLTSFFAALQLRGIKLGSAIQQVVTTVIGLIIVGFAIALFLTEPAFVGDAETVVAATANGIGPWSLVAAAIIVTYDGWLYASYFGGEIKGGGGAVARACLKGTATVVVLYALLNAAIVWSAPLSEIAGSDLALARAVEIAFSPGAASAVIAVAILILLNQQNLAYMGAPRILHALATDGLAAKRAQRVGTGGNPVFAVLVTWAFAVGLVLIGGFNFLLYLCAFFYLILYLVLICGVIILRRRKPDEARPYRAWGHPYSTAVCLAAWVVITAFQVFAEPETALYAAVMVILSWPVYRYLARSSTANARQS